MKVRGAMMARRGFAQRPNFRLTLMRKDLGLVLEECRRIGIPAPATSASHEALTGAVNRGLGDLDCAAVLAYVESIGGLAGYPWPTGTDT
jgi:3-hydroxyisobutyrate dehydrogenase